MFEKDERIPVRSGLEIETAKDMHAVKSMICTHMHEHFQRVRLVSASIEVEYVGEKDHHSGKMTGGHHFNSKIQTTDVKKL